MPPEARLEEWSTTRDHPEVSPYLAPEQRGLFLAGKAYGDPRFRPGEPVLTSAVRRVEGRVVTTHTGHRYRLGTPAASYLAWLSEHGVPFDPERPIKR